MKVDKLLVASISSKNLLFSQCLLFTYLICTSIYLAVQRFDRKKAICLYSTTTCWILASSVNSSHNIAQPTDPFTSSGFPAEILVSIAFLGSQILLHPAYMSGPPQLWTRGTHFNVVLMWYLLVFPSICRWNLTSVARVLYLIILFIIGDNGEQNSYLKRTFVTIVSLVWLLQKLISDNNS